MGTSFKNSGSYHHPQSATTELERIFKDVDEKQPRPDIKKALLLLGLGTLSWISTYSGLLELIKANSGDISFTYKMAIGFAVAMLMLMIVYILDQLFSPLNWAMRTIYVAGYIFLTIISVGFGFGFYWKFLESRSEATRSAESAITEVQSALQGGQTRLEQLETTLATLTTLSSQKAIEEREKGNSCPNSRPGDGPRRRLRDEDAKNFTFAGNFITQRSKSVAKDIKLLNDDMVKVASRHPSTVDPLTGNRNAFLKKLNQRLDLTITRFNAFKTDPQLTSIRNNFAERSNKTIFPNGNGGTFKCPDNQLQSALRGVVQAIDGLPVLRKPKIAAVEGSEATIEAFRRLAATLKGVVILKLPPSQEQLRETRKKAVRSLDKKQPPLVLNNIRPGLNERDYIPLAIAIFVDFCLLLVSINRPMDRLKSLVPVMKDARDGPISGILSSFHATHFTGIREEFSLFQHVVFDWGGHYYVAVPLASNDIQAQYLANLFVSLEGRGIVDRAMIPPGFIIRHKLKKMGSSFADHCAFRLYKFRNGAWSNIVLDAVMGAARDVAIENAKQRKIDQLPNHTSLDGEEINKNANFESLFENDNQALDKAKPILAENPAEPLIEMPRLLRDKKDKAAYDKQRKISKHTNGYTKSQNGHHLDQITPKPTDQHSKAGKSHSNYDLPPHQVNLNEKDSASIIRWPHSDKNEQTQTEEPEDQAGQKKMDQSVDQHNLNENVMISNIVDETNETEHGLQTSFDDKTINNQHNETAIDRSLSQQNEMTHLQKDGEPASEKTRNMAQLVQNNETQTPDRESLAKLVAEVKAEYLTEENAKAQSKSENHKDDSTHLDINEHMNVTSKNSKKNNEDLGHQNQQQSQDLLTNTKSELTMSPFEAITTVPDHISINKITDWYAGDKDE